MNECRCRIFFFFSTVLTDVDMLAENFDVEFVTSNSKDST